MTTATYPRIEPDADNITASMALGAAADSSGSGAPAGLEGLRFLPSRWLPSDQDYYWSEEWQAGEQETLRALANGEGVDFESTEDLIHWLFSSDEG